MTELTPTGMAALMLGAAVLLLPLSGQSPPRGTVVKPVPYPVPINLKVLPKNLTGLQVRDIMNSWSGDLGVRCGACHLKGVDPGIATAAEEQLFADDSNPAKATARLMYTMTDEINSRFIAKIENSGMPVTCGTCHQGNSSPAPFVASLHKGAGAEGKPPLNPADYQNKPCTACHAQLAGPFVYQHAPMQAEGCSACHSGHGSPNPHLLIKADVDAVCQQCHIPRPDPASGAHLTAGNNRSPAKSCIACHTDVHGSNRSPMFLAVPSGR